MAEGPIKITLTVDVIALKRIHNSLADATAQLRHLLDAHTADVSGVGLAAEAAAESAIREADMFAGRFGQYLEGGAV
jgi:hypothetical protein